MNKNLTGALFLILYVDVLPYACRLVHGVEWMMDYAREGIGGLLFYAVVDAMVAVPLVIAWWLRKRIPVTAILAFLTATFLIVSLNYTFDLASDPSIYIGLVFYPFFAAIGTTIVLVVSSVVEVILRRKKSAQA